MRHSLGFEGIGSLLMLYASIAVGFVLGLAVLIPIAIRVGSLENRQADKSVLILLCATLFGPLSGGLFLALSLFASIRNSFIEDVGSIVFEYIPVISLALAIIGLVFAFRSRVFIVKLGAIVIAGFFLLSSLSLGEIPLPPFDRIFDALR